LPSQQIPLSDLDYGQDEEAAVLRVLRSRWLSMGPEVQAFESECAAYLGVKHAFAVSSGTAALHLAYVAAGIGPGDEIVQPALNFVAAANMTVAIGAVPVFADIVSLTEPTIDPDDVESLITPRTRAVVVMHYGGYLARLAELRDVCRKHGIVLIEDACHAIGGTYHDPRNPSVPAFAGAVGEVGCFSFFANKNLPTGEGGMVVTNRDAMAERIRLLRSHGMTTLTWDRHRGHAKSYDVVAHGYNYRLDELHAALARCGLRKLDVNNRRRRELTAAYHHAMAGIDGWTVPFRSQMSGSACHLSVALAPTTAARDTAAAQLKQAGIQTSVHYPCVTTFSAFAGMSAAAVPRSREFAGRVLTLPLFPTMTFEQVTEICRQIGVAERREVSSAN
jgi:dTDP-4-amino-4,6-dideoxygalactose transaminase